MALVVYSSRGSFGAKPNIGMISPQFARQLQTTEMSLRSDPASKVETPSLSQPPSLCNCFFAGVRDELLAMLGDVATG